MLSGQLKTSVWEGGSHYIPGGLGVGVGGPNGDNKLLWVQRGRISSEGSPSIR